MAETKSRELAAQFVCRQLENDVKGVGDSWHYGLVELRKLLDYIYGEEPTNMMQEINKDL